jgi:hypothetical protein
MSKATAIATKCDTVLRPAGLTVAQENAVDALASGMKDADTAALVGVNRVTVTRWRLYSPHFRAALTERRRAIWTAGMDRLRSLIPLALDAVADELAKPDNPNRLQSAFGLLKLVPLTIVAQGPTDPDEIVRDIVAERRRNARGPFDDAMENDKGLPDPDEHTRQVWDELTAKAGELPG